MRESKVNTPKIIGCLICGYRTGDGIEIANWTGCPNCTEKEIRNYSEKAMKRFAQ